MEPATISALIIGGSALLSSVLNKLSTSGANAANLKFAEKQFAEQKFLNRNQIQLQAADAMKAGINPASMNTSSLSSGNFQSNQSPADYSGIAEAGSQIASAYMQSKMNDKQIQAQKEMNDANNANTLKLERIKQFNENARESARLRQQAVQSYMARRFDKLKWKDTFSLEQKRFEDSVKTAKILRLQNYSKYYQQMQEAYRAYKRGNRESAGGLLGPVVDAMWELDLLNEKGMSFDQFVNTVNKYIDDKKLW